MHQLLSVSAIRPEECLPSRVWHVAIVTETYPPEVNGVALTIERVVQGLQARHHQVDVYRPHQHTGDVIQYQQRVRHILLPGVDIPWHPGVRVGLPCTSELLAFWQAQRPDVVHIATEGPLGWSALAAARRLDLPVTSDYRTHFAAYSTHYGISWMAPWIARYLRWFHNRTDCTMVPTDAMRQSMSLDGYNGLEVVARGVDTQLFNPSRRSSMRRSAWQVPDTEPVALYVGRLAAEKNLGLLVKAFKAMQASRPGLRLVIVGDGPERDALQVQCTGAIFLGTLRGDELAVVYASADLFIFPSLSETYGNVIPEALASGLAVVAFDCAAAAELITSGVSGTLVQVGCVEEFVAACSELARHQEKIARLKSAAPSAVRELDWSAIVIQIERIWNRRIVRQQ